jgi:hypothetical protein
MIDLYGVGLLLRVGPAEAKDSILNRLLCVASFYSRTARTNGIAPKRDHPAGGGK